MNRGRVRPKNNKKQKNQTKNRSQKSEKIAASWGRMRHARVTLRRQTFR